jgi:hypothetical protein
MVQSLWEAVRRPDRVAVRATGVGLALVLAVAAPLAVAGVKPLYAGGVVGHGTPASCTESALDSALTGGGSVTFNCGNAPDVLKLTSEKVISASTSIDGAGLITLSGGRSTRLFNVQSGGTLTLTNLTLSDGNAGNSNGGAVLIAIGGAVALADVTLSNNAAVNGAGIYNLGGGAALLNVTLSGNTASASGGGMFIGSGPVSTNGTTTLTNVTLSGNSATNGGGLFDLCESVTLLNVTLGGNSASSAGGGLYNASVCPLYPHGSSGAFSLSLKNTVVADSPAGGNCYAQSIPIVSQGFNLSNDTSCSSYLNQPTDFNDVNAMLNPLANNGGPTPTHLPQPGSPLIDHGTNVGCPHSDQRGVTRRQGAACDIGAVEVIEVFLPVILR